MARFGKRGKLSPRYIRPFEILERVGTVVYRLALPLSLLSVHEGFHVSMLWKYTPNPTHVVDWGELVVDADETLKEGPVRIMDNREQALRHKIVRLVKVLWQHHEWRKQHGNARTRCVPPILSYLRMKVRCLVIWKLNDCCIYM